MTLESLSEDETRYVASLTGAWLEDSAYTLPDFSGLPRWDDAWNLPSELFWSFECAA